jgi:hypothetical protein
MNLGGKGKSFYGLTFELDVAGLMLLISYISMYGDMYLIE